MIIIFSSRNHHKQLQRKSKLAKYLKVKNNLLKIRQTDQKKIPRHKEWFQVFILHAFSVKQAKQFYTIQRKNAKNYKWHPYYAHRKLSKFSFPKIQLWCRWMISFSFLWFIILPCQIYSALYFSFNYYQSQLNYQARFGNQMSVTFQNLS